MIPWVVFSAIAIGIPFLILRKASSVRRAIMAWLSGFAVTFVAAFGLFVLFAVTILDPDADTRFANRAILGPGIWCAIFGPFLGIYWARIQRRKRVQAGAKVH